MTFSSDELLYIDQALIICNKPAGLLSVPGRGADKQDSLLTRVQQIYPDTHLVHRLDMTTSGLMLMARSKHHQSLLGKIFEQRQIKKTYLAWVAGLPLQDQGSIELPLMPDWPARPRQKIDLQQGKYALTHYQVLKRLPAQQKSLLSIEPHTGRTHQIRVHLSALGHPILGDTLYAPIEHAYTHPRLMLHAWQLAFKHPDTQQPVCFKAEPDFELHDTI